VKEEKSFRYFVAVTMVVAIATEALPREDIKFLFRFMCA
jgi:hypothetical protein